MLLPLLVRPQLALGLGALVLLAAAAWRSIAAPLALAAVPPIVFGIFAALAVPEGAVALALAGAVAISLFAAAQRRDAAPPAAVVIAAPLVASLLLVCLLVVRQPETPDTNYGEIKTAFFVVSNVTLLIAGLWAGWQLAHTRHVLIGTLGVSVAGGVLLVLHVAGGQALMPFSLTFSEPEHSISMGRQMAAGALVALGIVLSRERASSRLVAATSLPILATALLASGARGPVVALLAGSAVLLFLGLSDRVARRRLLAVGAIALACLVMVPLLVPDSSLVRSFSFASTDVESTSSGRTEMWRQSWELISANPVLGIGTGGYADVNPPMIYSHNLMLEVWVELGMLGPLLVLALLASVGARMLQAFRRAGRDERALLVTVFALFVAATVNAMFSYALHGNWEIWLWGGIGSGMAARIRSRTPA